MAIAATPSITIASVTGSAGQSANVGISLANNGETARAAAISLVIAFDPTKFSATPTAVAGSAATAVGKSFDAQVSPVSASLSTVNILISGGSSAIGNGTLATITFPVSAGAAGIIPITFDSPPDISDPATAQVTVTTVDGKITVADITKPTVDAFTLPTTSKSLTVPVSSLTASDNVAVTHYLLTTESSATATSSLWSATKPTTYTFTTGGFKTVYAWAKDAAGNVSLSKSASVTVDTVAPTVSAFTIPATSTSLTVAITTLTATDVIGVAGYLVTESSTAPDPDASGWTAAKPTTFTCTTGGSTTLYAWAKDAAGNVSAGISAGVTITLPGPTLTFDAATLANGTATKNPALNLKGSVTANGFAVQGLTVQLNGGVPVAVTWDGSGAFNKAILLVAGENGANTITTVATDANSRTSTDTRVITLNAGLADLEVTSPSTDVSYVKDSFVTVTGRVGAPQSTTVTLTLNGALSSVGLNGDQFSSTVNLVSGSNSIIITATDSVTGTHTKTLSVTYDPTAPALAVSAPADAAFFTAKSSVLLSGSVTDATTASSDISVIVKVNGTALNPQPVLTEGSFSVVIPLSEVKEYAIVVTATDPSLNSSSVQRNVTRAHPSGNVTDGVSAPTIVDAEKVLRFVLKLDTPSADQKTNVDVAPVVSGKPAPDGAVNGGDLLVILEKMVGTLTW